MNPLWDNIFRKEERDKSLIHILSQNLLFKNLSKRELRFVEKIVHKRIYRKGEYIFQQGEVGVGMYIIVKGQIEIAIVDDSSEIGVPGSEVSVTELSAGDFFGEISLVEEGGKRSASAIAIEDSILIGFFKPDLLEILERSPATGVKVVFRLAEVLGKRLKETTEKITQLKKELKKHSDKKVKESENSTTKTHST